MTPLRALLRGMRRTRLTAAALDTARPVYRFLRTRWLRLRSPYGGFVSGNGVRVFCNFRDPNYSWYDANAPNLAFDLRVIRSLIEQSDGTVFMDIGAHYGFYSAFLTQALSGRTTHTRVIAFEPDDDAFCCLERTLSAAAGDVRVTPLRMALGDFDGEATLYRTPDAACSHTYHDGKGKASGTAPIRRLDTLCGNLLAPGERIAFIKVDVDGAEPAFLRGAVDTLESHRPLLFIEFGPAGLASAGANPREYFDTLCEGFHTYWVSFQRGTVRRVTQSDYEEIAADVGERVTDFVLSQRRLTFPEFVECP